MEATLFLYLPLLLVSYVFTQLIIHKLRKLPPSPFPTLPLIGHLHLLKPPVHQTLAKLSDRYGPVTILWFGCRRVLVINSPSAAEECFTKNDVVFSNRPRLLIGKHLGYNYTSLVWAPFGEHWRNLRRIASLELLSAHRLQTLSHIRVDEVRALTGKLFQVSEQDTDRAVDLKSLFFQFTFNAMMRMIAGKKYYGQGVVISEEARRFQEKAEEISLLVLKSSKLDYLPFLQWFGINKKTEKRIIALYEERDKFMQDLIEKHHEMDPDDSSSGGRKRSMIEILLSLQKTEPEYYTDDKIRSLMLVLFHAGSDSTTQTMEWAMTNLLNNPRVLKKAQAEIDNLVGYERLIDDSDVAKLPYLHWIIKETTRMHPSTPLLTPRESSADCTVGGFRIPRGTMLLVNLWAIQNDPRVWEEPGKFMPERFEGMDERKDRFKMMPFGAGRRACPGEGLAIRVLGLVLGSLVQCFDWERGSEDLVDLSTGAGAAAKKALPLTAKCRARPEMKKLLSKIAAGMDL
ncbi:hypothetical protein NMG60_11016496 [Bertholletia excelsa]